MSRPEDIPQDVWDVALRTWAEMLTVDHDHNTELAAGDVEEIARAIFAERERCAKIAEKAFGGPAHTYASENADIYRAQDSACYHIAALIRKPANSNFKSVPHRGSVS